MAEQAKKQLPAPKGEGKPQQLTLVEQVEQELQTISSDNFYQVPGRGGQSRMEPDSRALQHYANKSGGIATKIVDSGMDDKKAWAHVQAWKKSDPALVKEDKVTIVYSMELQNYVWDYIKNGCKRHRGGCPVLRRDGQVVFMEDGTPVLEDTNDMLDLKLLLSRKMRFAERECITKAEGRLHKKLLNFDWREQEEIENEVLDVARIGEKSTVVAAQSTAPKEAAAAPAAAPTAKPAEAPKAAPAATTATQAKQETKKAEKPKEEPKKAAAPAQAAPSKEEPKQEEVTKPPKAAIPTMAEVQKTAEAKQTELLPKVPSRSERIAALVATGMQCSAGNIMAFMAFAINCTQAELPTRKPEMDATLAALEILVKQVHPSTVGTYIKKEHMSKEYKDKLDEQFILLFAQERNKQAEVK